MWGAKARDEKVAGALGEAGRVLMGLSTLGVCDRCLVTPAVE
jgi:hypothetical protein